MIKSRKAKYYLMVGVVVVSMAVLLFLHGSKPSYVVKNGKTAFLCEAIGKSDFTDDRRSATIQKHDLKREYAIWKQQKGSCDNIDQVIILE